MRREDPLAILEAALGRAKAAGADAADALMARSRSLNLAWRLGKREALERAELAEIGLRVFSGKRQALVSSSDLSPTALNALAERALAMARAVPEDPHCGLADPDQLARASPDLDLCDPHEPEEAELLERAAAAEAAALAVPGVTNSEGARAEWSRSETALATSSGFAAAYPQSGFALSLAVVAGEGGDMQTDYDYTAATHLADLLPAAAIGRAAGMRAVRRLHPRKPQTASLPMIFEPRVANSLLSHLAAAVNGATIARGTSFLKDRLGQAVFAAGVEIVDDPLRRRGPVSAPFDGEGLPGRRLKLVEDGVLKSWLLDCRSARQLGLRSTAHARRGASNLPRPGASNLYLAAGKDSPQDLIGGIASGLYVTNLIGFGVNGVTGDYSRGAAGFWIERGEIAYPVSELTIAGTLQEMFRHLTPANDLDFRYGFDAPTLRIDGMTVAGR